MPYSDKDFKESNVNYINKDFSSLKNSLIQYAKTYFPNSYRDFNETSPGMMMIEMSAYVGDVLSFYIDQQYREMMLPLAEERRNVVNMAKMLGYKTKSIVPAYVDLKFTQVVSADSVDASKPDYSEASIFDMGVSVTSTTDSTIIFETLEEVDFTESGSIKNPINPIVNSTNADTGVVTDWKLTRVIKAMSGETKTKTFDIGTPSKFKKITLSETNVIEIISVKDSNGNKWYEVDYLVQDKVPIETHYLGDDLRDNAGDEPGGGLTVMSLQVPYSLEYIQTNKRFITEINDDNLTSLVFGNGVLNNGNTLEGSFLDLEQSGITIPGQTSNLDSFINPLLGDEYASLGETPSNTTLTVTYRIGGGIAANVPSGDLTTTSPTAIGGNGSGTINSVTNELPAVGGKSQDTVDEIRQKAMAFFSTQNRCVTKEDYEARILALPSKFGNIAKVYVSREASEAVGGGQTPELGMIVPYILAYDNNKNLVGDPRTSAVDYPEGNSDGTPIPTLLSINIKKHLEPFKILTDLVEIKDGHIINFGVFFDVVAHRHANKKQVKFACIQKIIDYFNIDKMQFRQPIYISQLEYELMGIDGVRAVNGVTITQTTDYNVTGGQSFNPYLYSHSIDGNEVVNEDGSGVGQTGYGYLYEFKEASSEDGSIIFPSQDPSVFELKNPKQNVKGVVK